MAKEADGTVEFPGDELEVLGTGLTLGNYRDAPSGIGPLAYQWADKPHRLVYDLINEVRRLSQSGRCSANADGKCRPDYPNGCCADCGARS